MRKASTLLPLRGMNAWQTLLLLLLSSAARAAQGPSLFDDAGLKSVRRSPRPALIKLNPDPCDRTKCASMDTFWAAIAAKLPAGSVWAARCAEWPSVCAESGVRGDDFAPVLLAHVRGSFVRYGGEFQKGALLQWAPA